MKAEVGSIERGGELPIYVKRYNRLTVHLSRFALCFQRRVESGLLEMLIGN
jgi:hypothetical protein